MLEAVPHQKLSATFSSWWLLPQLPRLNLRVIIPNQFHLTNNKTRYKVQKKKENVAIELSFTAGILSSPWLSHVNMRELPA